MCIEEPCLIPIPSSTIRLQQTDPGVHGHVGISGRVFHWFKSYISNRHQRVHIDCSLSCPQDPHFGVPQGSVLGHFLFCLYTTSISQIITTHDGSHHMHADDTQVYIELSQSDTHKSISSLSDCLTDISLWMKSSKLKLNSDKTELLLLAQNSIDTNSLTTFQLNYLTMIYPHLIAFAI